jgi:3' exoribonuclease, RNase T-like
MRYFIDTEFNERGCRFPIELISIAIVAEDGREFYAHSAYYNPEDCNQWVKEHVLSQVESEPPMSLWSISQSIKEFIGNDDKPEFWGYYADYDWVVFCQIFGTMAHLPKGFPMYCRDIKQLCDDLGNPKLPKQTSVTHHALNDARWNFEAWKMLQSFKAGTWNVCQD